jgi:hypothetical protein
MNATIHHSYTVNITDFPTVANDGTITSELDGLKVSYKLNSIFEVQTGKDKGRYQTKHKFTGSLVAATLWFNSTNVGNGYKKRLLMDGKTLAVARS